MAVSLTELLDCCNNLLKPTNFKDYCPNGLQVDAGVPVNKLVTGVTASQALIDRAVALQADAILVHHGYFWKGEQDVLTGVKGRRIRTLLQNEVSLLAYHLPLDAHPVLGNNRQLADILGLDVVAGLDDSPNPVGNWGKPQAGSTFSTVLEFASHIEECLGRAPQLLGHAHDFKRPVKKVAWCTGAAQSMIELAAAKQVDCFISGEVSEQTAHLACELGLPYIGAGHHATERYGVKALGEHLADAFDLSVEFVDIDNPV